MLKSFSFFVGKSVAKRGMGAVSSGARILFVLFFASAALPVVTGCGVSYGQTSSSLAIAAVSPASGSTKGASAVTVTGSGFQPGMQVWFGPNQATVISVSANAAQVVTPAHAAGSVQLAVTSKGSVAYSGYIYKYVAGSSGSSGGGSTSDGSNSAALTISGISPEQGSTSGTTSVTLTGTGFKSAMTVWFGAAQAAVKSLSATSAVVIAPKHATGEVEVAVMDSSTNEASTGYIFKYVNSTTPPPPTPQISAVSPGSGSADHAASVTLSGANFVSGSQVKVGGKTATGVSVQSGSSIKATLPAMAPGSYTVEVVTPSNTVASLNNAFKYVAGLAIVTSALPNATVGKTYAATVDATGGVAPYNWSVASGSLPAGLSLSSGGTIAGAATKTGVAALDLRATDSKGATAEEAYSLDVVAQQSSGPSPTGTALAKCQAINKTGSYYLANDVTCTTQGFALNANNVTLNLNGKTITYGASGSVVPAISICDNWYNQLPASSCQGTGHHQSPAITNGKIVQAANSAGFTPAIWVGQGTNVTAGTISDLTITVETTGSRAIYGDYPGGGWVIKNNTINDNVTNIQKPGQIPELARVNFQGVALYWNDGLTVTQGDTITDNTFNGTPQGAILDTNQNSRITNNVITLSSYYSNDYGVTILVDGQVVSGNQISGRGRGVDAEASGFTISGNTINVHEEANNSEYNGCELAGSDGIRIKQYITSATNPSTMNAEGNPVPALTGWTVSKNVITVTGTDCEANGIDFTNITQGVSGTVSGNSFTVTGPKFNVSLYFNGAAQPLINYSNNTFTAAQYCSVIGNEGDMWPSADTTVQAGQHWSCPTQVAAQDLSSGTGTGAEGLNLQDTFAKQNVICGPYSTALVQLGSYKKQCGQ
ncbi:MAG: IPT/TIG domain-containing protein [Acidobacteriaceae bacterium]